MSSDERERAHSLLSRIRDGATFLTDAGAAFKGSGIARGISASSELADAALVSAAESFAIVKFVATFLEKVTRDKPTIPNLAFVACATAYQQSLYEAIALVGPPAHDKFKEQVSIALDVFASADAVDFATLSYDNLLSHEFIRKADAATEIYATDAGYDPAERTRLMGVLHRLFGRKLRLLIGNPALREKFAPLLDYLQMKDAGVAAHQFLERHAVYQRTLFERAPVLKIEPFALRDIYVDTDCGVLRWAEFRKGLTDRAEGGRFDPFLDEFGGRHSLLDTVMNFIESPVLDDAIVIQGVAGVGKSSFTLRLCVELQDRGLLPIRVPLRSLAVDDQNRSQQPFGEALARAIRVSDDRTESPSVAVRQEFINGTIFEETVPYGSTRICPYVLIFDGWDEISISSSEGFRQRVEGVLSTIRSTYLGDGRGRIRVILTGRPSQDVNETGFFLDQTPILTMRHMKPESVEYLFERVRSALETLPIRNQERWTLPPPEELAPVLEEYKAGFDKDRARGGTMDVLGLPLLAHIALRLFGVWKGTLKALITSPTTLYRSLVDITCDKGGQPSSDDLELAKKARLAPEQLRMMLRDTAIAITAYGTDNIPSTELEKRLRRSFEHLEAGATAAAKYPLSSLMINFFFKGGFRELGCEFLHKSFREYLFAEGVVEILKKYAADHRELPAERPRELYWKEFDPIDPRWQLTQDLMEALAAQWMTPEIDGHIHALIEWEVARAVGKDAPGTGTPTEPLTLAQWEWIRDVLADLWDWWGEGTHLRPQPNPAAGGDVFTRSRMDDLVAWCAPPPKRGVPYSRPPRTVTLDAHLGDALFRLTVATHWTIAFNTGWTKYHRRPHEMWAGVQKIGEGCRRYQSRVVQGKKTWVFFAPTGPDETYFHLYSSRIDGAGYRPGGTFPLGARCWALDLRESFLRIPAQHGWTKVGSWQYCNFEFADASGSSFTDHHLIFVHGRGASFDRCSFERALVEACDFANTDLSDSIFRFARVYELDVRQAVLHRSQWEDASGRETVLSDKPLPD